MFQWTLTASNGSCSQKDPYPNHVVQLPQCYVLINTHLTLAMAVELEDTGNAHSSATMQCESVKTFNNRLSWMLESLVNTYIYIWLALTPNPIGCEPQNLHPLQIVYWMPCNNGNKNNKHEVNCKSSGWVLRGIKAWVRWNSGNNLYSIRSLGLKNWYALKEF